MKLKVSEIFYSAQGEGRFVGVPSLFLRTYGCNFKCAGFGMPRGESSTEANSVAIAYVNSKNTAYERYEDLPLVTTGCDSYASWHPSFKDLSPTLETDAVVDRMLDLIPESNWHQSNGNDVHLVITGGEPLLGWQRAYPDLLDNPKMRTLKNITFETNGTQMLSEEFKQYLYHWQRVEGREITFSVSAKLSASGEAWAEAVKPEVVACYETVGTVVFKFVVEKPSDFDEVDRAVQAYRAAGIKGVVYVMPVGGVVSVYDGNKFNIADEAMLRGYYYSPRLHVDLWGNSWGK